jgi:hypothetical protein
MTEEKKHTCCHDHTDGENHECCHEHENENTDTEEKE